jgi:hypothetical protein
MTTENILRQIEQLQAIQKTHRTTDSAWEVAGELLAPLFEEMARREPANCENS